MPRRNPRKAQAIVCAHLRHLLIAYAETLLVGLYAIVLRHLRELGVPLRRLASTFG
jgi:hypothetical protein